MFCHTCNAEFSREEAKEVLIGEDDCDLKCCFCGSSRIEGDEDE